MAKDKISPETVDGAENFTETGMFEGVPFEVYTRWPGLRKTRLWTCYEKTAAHYRYEIDHPDDRDSQALMIGRASHVAILEPDAFEKRYIPPPKPPVGATWDKRIPAHRDAWNEWVAKIRARGLTELKQEDWDRCRYMRDAVHAHPAAKMLLAEGRPEVSIQWRDEGSDLLLKARLDLWIESGGVLADLKSARCAAPRRFGSAAYNYGYPFQMSLYWAGAKQVSGVEMGMPVLIAFEKEPPWAVACYELDGPAMEIGRAQYQSVLNTIVRCKETGVWPGYDEGLMELVLPGYAGHELSGQEMG